MIVVVRVVVAIEVVVDAILRSLLGIGRVVHGGWQLVVPSVPLGDASVQAPCPNDLPIDRGLVDTCSTCVATSSNDARC